MMRPLNSSVRATGRDQTGATLLVAIMMLLIITLLALSSMRGVSLESRITGNLRLQKTLTNAAEAGLRMGEESVSRFKCVPSDNKPCLNSLNLSANANGDYAQLFTSANADYLNAANGYAQLNTTTANASPEVKVQWYVVDLRQISGQTQNNCALMATGCGRHYYEITACASTVLCSENAAPQRVILRSVFGVSN